MKSTVFPYLVLLCATVLRAVDYDHGRQVGSVFIHVKCLQYTTHRFTDLLHLIDTLY